MNIEELRKKLLHNFEIKVGDKFITRQSSDECGKVILTVTKLEDFESRDGWVYYRMSENLANRRNGRARIWWFRDCCIKIPKGVEAHKCPCGKEATYICECGCLCCGEDPCAYGCNGAVLPLAEGIAKGIKPKVEKKEVGA